MENLAVKYCGCMEELKQRLEVVKTVTQGGLSLGGNYFDYELVSIHLRKSLELIAFGTLTANKVLYSEAHRKFRRHWNAKRLLENLERINADFYPRPIFLASSEQGGVRHFESVQRGFLTKEDFVFLYDRCGETLHARNPFADQHRSIQFQRRVGEWVGRIERLLRLHLMQIAGREEIWVVDMRDARDGKVHAFIASPTGRR